MDPVATLIAAHQAAQAGDVEECLDFLRAYHNWRILGGFEPCDVEGANFHIIAGDAFAKAVREMLP